MEPSAKRQRVTYAQSQYTSDTNCTHSTAVVETSQLMNRLYNETLAGTFQEISAHQQDTADCKNYLQVMSVPQLNIKKIIRESLLNTMICVQAGTFPGAPCYLINTLPTEHYDLVSSFLPKGDKASLKQTSRDINRAVTLVKPTLASLKMQTLIPFWFGPISPDAMSSIQLSTETIHA